ncbi:acetate--CoA ligase family protein [Candidatus Peribacteria bacterium]|nr:acetate--CoA ligase family protein [Candidatus Peribacteria bacterium]
MQALLAPQSIAVIGASRNPDTLGTIILQNCISAGFTGRLIPVNPKYAGEQILGYTCEATITQETAVDMAVIVVPSTYVEQIVSECIEAQVGSVIIISAGFAEVGNQQLQERIAKKLRAANIPLLGPNCLGIIAPAARLNASFADGSPLPGGIAFASQSGAFCTALLDWALAERIGFSHFVSLGNAAGVTETELLQAWDNDPAVHAMVFYLETIHQVNAWKNSLQKTHKPIIVLQPGASTAARQASRSHTGSLAPNARITEEFYRSTGVVQVRTMRQMQSLLQLLSSNPTPKSSSESGITVVTNAGGIGVMTADILAEYTLPLAPLSEETRTLLREILPPAASVLNPIDIIGDAGKERYEATLRCLITRPEVEEILLLMSPQKNTQIVETCTMIAALQTTTKKPIRCVLTGGEKIQPGREVLEEHQVAHFPTPSEAIEALSLLRRRHKDPLPERPDTMPKHPRLATPGLQNQQITSALCAAYGIFTPPSKTCTTLKEALHFTQQYAPIVLKIDAPAAVHKTELHGVRLHLSTREEVSTAWESLQQNITEQQLEGARLLAQQMIPEDSIAVIAGIKRDPHFGPVMVVGAGGIYAELIADTALRILPTSAISTMLEGTKVGRILQGERGQHYAISALLELLERLQTLALCHPELREIDLNPVLITAEAAYAVDVKFLV